MTSIRSARLSPSLVAPQSTSAAAQKSRAQARAMTDSFAPAAETSGRTPALRNAWELSAPWRAVNMVENGQKLDEYGSYGSYPQVPPNYDYRDNVAQHLKDFITYGQSSLTPYEAKELAQGLGFSTSSVKTNGRYTLGDRVNVTYSGAKSDVTTRGIVARIYSDGQVGVLVRDQNDRLEMVRERPGANPKDELVIRSLKRVTGALDDGRL